MVAFFDLLHQLREMSISARIVLLFVVYLLAWWAAFGPIPAKTVAKDAESKAGGTDDKFTLNAPGGTIHFYNNTVTPPPAVPELRTLAAKTVQEVETKDEQRKLREKYQWGYRIYGVDKFGGTETYLNRLTKEYDLDWDSIRFISDPKTGTFHIDIPPINSKAGSVGAASLGTSTKVRKGDTMSIVFGALAISAEVRDVSEEGVIVLIGLAEDDSIAKLDKLKEQFQMAESVINRVNELYNKGDWETIWREAHPELRAATSREAFDRYFTQMKDALGDFISGGRVLTHRVDSPALAIDVKYRAKFAKREKKEMIYIIRIVGDQASFRDITVFPDIRPQLTK